LATAAVLLAATRTAFPEQLADGLAPHRAARLCYVTWPAPAPGAQLATEGQPTHIAVPIQDWLERKVAAFDAHRTQRQHHAHFELLALRDTECFFVASGRAARRGATDLFDDL
jgi:LmbE family N-acetylglucosaminyl deacetylase